MQNKSKKVFTPQKIWDVGYKNTIYKIASPQDAMRIWLENFISTHKGEGLECLEIGCYPARYLSVFGKHGYKLSGIDLTPRVYEIKSWLIKENYHVDSIVHEDFFKYKFQKKFDVVCSFGFIEHFEDWKMVLKKHFDLVKPGGYLIVTAPNFKGFIQWLFHWLFDRNNLHQHNLQSMTPKQWSKIASKHNFKTVFAGWFGQIHFWTDSEKQSFIGRKIVKIVKIGENLLKPYIKYDSQHYSPFCGIIAKKL